jgi:hypothetical protein
VLFEAPPDVLIQPASPVQVVQSDSPPTTRSEWERPPAQGSAPKRDRSSELGLGAEALSVRGL